MKIDESAVGRHVFWYSNGYSGADVIQRITDAAILIGDSINPIRISHNAVFYLADEGLCAAMNLRERILRREKYNRIRAAEDWYEKELHNIKNEWEQKGQHK